MLVAAVATSFAGSPAFGSAFGIGGYSGNPAVNSGQTCALCHFGGPASTATIFDDVTGTSNSSTVVSGATRHFRFRITGGAGSKCGFGISATGGTLSPSAGDVKPAASPVGELTHNGAKAFSAGVCEFGFDWQAPVVGSTTSLMFYGAGNSADGSGFSDFDSITTDTHSITVNPPTPAALSCTTSSFSPSVTQGQNAGDQGFSCSNTGGGSLSYSVSDDAAWLAVAPGGASGLGGGASQSHTVSYATAALAPGNYSGTVTVNGGAAGTKLITVSLSVNSAPALSCTTASLSPSVTQGQNAGDQGFSCSNTGGGSLSYSVSDDAAWLAVAPGGASGLGGGASQSHTASYATAALAPGDYSGTVTLNGGAAGTKLIAVNLTVSPVIGGPPPNDDWQDAVAVSPPGEQFEGTLVDATSDGSDSLGLSTGRGDVWYVYTAGSAGVVHADTCGTNDLIGIDAGTDTILSMHFEAPGTVLNELAANDDFPSSATPMACDGIDQGQMRDSAVEAAVDAGDSVYVRVTSNQFGGSAGSFVLDLTPEPEPTLLALGAVAALAWLARRSGRGSGTGCTRRRRNG